MPLFCIGIFFVYMDAPEFNHSTNIEECDFVFEGEWEKQPNMLQAQYAAVGCVCNDKLYIFKTQVQCFAPLTQQWTSLQMALPFEKGFQSCVSVGGSIYLLTAYYCELLVVFDPDSQTVATRDAPKHRCCGMIPWEHKKLCFWRYKDNGSTVAVFTYNTDNGETEEWYADQNLHLANMVSVVKYPDFRSWKSMID